MQAAGGEGTAAGTAPFPPTHTPGVAPRGGDLPRSDIGGLGTCGTPGGGGAYGAGRRSGGEGWSQCPLPTRPRCPHACPGGPHIWSTGRGWGTGTCTGRGTGTRRPSTPPTLRGPLPCPPPQGSAPGPGRGGAPGPPDTLYIDIFPRTHTRDPRGTAKTPEKRGKTPQQPVPEESKTQPGRGGGGRGRREGVAPAGQGGPGKAPGGLGGRVGRAGRGGRGRRPPAHFLFLSWLASQSRPS